MSDESTPKSGKSRLKGIVVIAGALIVEAALIIGAMMMIGGPVEVQAGEGLEAAEPSEEDKIVECQVLDSRLPNNKTGVTYLYPTEVYVQVKRKHFDRVQGELDQFQNEIRSEIAAIWRTSEPHHFQEPRLENLTRKVYALLSERFGDDPSTEEPIVAKAVIVMETGFRVDG